MNRHEEELLARYLEGEISPEEEADLLDLLRRDPGAADQLESFLRLDEGLREAIVPEASGDALVRAVAERLARRGGTGVFARQVVEQIASAEKSGRKKTRWIRVIRRPQGRSPGSWTLPLVAAAALFAILIVAAVASQGKTRPSRPALPPLANVPDPAPPPEADRTAPPSVTPRREKRIAVPDKEQRPIPENPGEPLPRRDLEIPLREPAPVRPEDPKLPAPDVPRPAAPSTTVTAPSAVAQIERVEGEGVLLAEGARLAAKPGQGVFPGQGLETVGAQSRASIIFSDRTRVELGSATQVLESGGARGKRFDVNLGTVSAVVSRQPVGQPMVFETPHATAEVRGTELRITVDAVSTRLEVKEGLVRFVPKDGNAPVEVGADQFATAKAGLKPAALSMPIHEIVLLPDQVRYGGPDSWWGVRVQRREFMPKGADWRRVADRDAIGGQAFEAPLVWNGADTDARSKSRRLMQSYVEFGFRADADKDYHVWVRGRSTAKPSTAPGQEWYRFDLVGLEPVNADATSKHLPMVEGRAYEFNGFGQLDRYWWISGNADPGDPTMPRGMPTNPEPLRIRFERSGLQMLRVHPIETPMRFDAVWLSATQKTRPLDDHPGLEVPKK